MGRSGSKKDPGRFAKVYRCRPARPLPLRRGVQLLTAGLLIVVGWQFADFVCRLEQGLPGGTRPAGVEAFLPIGALISLRHWIVNGAFSMAHPAGLVILLLVLGTGLLLRKAFCSWICPIGLLSEALARLAHLALRIRLKLPAWLDWPLMSLKYLILAFFAHAIFVQMSPEAIAEFVALPYNRVADIKMYYFFAHITTFAAWTVAILVLLSFVIPYFWCRYLCPYGALLGLVGFFSLTRVRRSAPVCTDCTRCAGVCPSFIAVDRKTHVLSPECTGCMECVASCPAEGALEIAILPGRRLRVALFAVIVVALFYGGIGVAKVAGFWESDIPRQELQERVQRGLDDPEEYGHFRGGFEEK